MYRNIRNPGLVFQFRVQPNFYLSTTSLHWNVDSQNQHQVSLSSGARLSFLRWSNL